MSGGTRTFHGQRYVFVRAFDRERRDGTLATILVWRSRCADCGGPFEITTPAVAAKFQPNRRCQRHKRPGQRVRSAEA